MARVTFRIEGTQQTMRNLNMYDMDRKRKAQDIVKKHTNAVRKAARRTVPVTPNGRRKSAGSPGDLKKSIRSKYYYNNLGSWTAPTIPKGSHRNIVEKGTVNRRTKRGANRGRVSPQPFMEPAKRAQEGSYNRAMKALWEDDETQI